MTSPSATPLALSDESFLSAALALASDGPDTDVSAALAAFPPGRRAGLERMRAFDPRTYARGRNHVTSPRVVSALAPYLRAGLVSAPEVRNHAVASGRRAAEKFVQELGWREYWRHVLDRRGRGVYDDIEAPKHRHARVPGLPDAWVRADTGLNCVDLPLEELFETGYVHNHARMWLASALIHLEQRHHAPGAALFAEHLLCHDPASNSLSWQWVESSFSHRPYLYNRGNVERYAPEYCATCPAGQAGQCPFETSYDELATRLLGPARPPPPPAAGAGARYAAPPPERRPDLPTASPAPDGHELTWVHTSSLGACDPALAAGSGPVAIVLDRPYVEAQPHAAKRLAFVAHSALETARDLREQGREVALAVDDPAHALLALGAGRVLATDAPDPWIRDSLDRLEAAGVDVERSEPALLAPGARDVPDRTLGRFSRWWRKAEREALSPQPPLAASM